MKRIYQYPSSLIISLDEESMLAVSELEIETDLGDQVDAEDIGVRLFEPFYSEGDVEGL